MPQRRRRKAPRGGPQRSCSSRKPFRESKRCLKYESTRWTPGKPKESYRKTSATLSNAHANQQWYIHISLHNDPACCARALPTWTSASTSSFACIQPYHFKQVFLGLGLVPLPRGCNHTATHFAAWLWFRSTFQALECWMLSRLCRS